jgi:hypothetical protein
MNLDWTALLLVLLAATGWGALLIVAIACRCAISERVGLPMWRFLRRSGIWRSEAAVATGVLPILRAELRCALCAERPRCLDQDHDRFSAPPAHCPNARLLHELRQERSGEDVAKAARPIGG